MGVWKMKRIKPIALWLAVLLAIAIALIYVEADLLWKIQQYNLFLYSPLYFKQQMVEPGGMLSYIGAFFTQFFYYPWQGVLLLCGLWLLLLWLIKRTFRIPDRWNIVALIPIAILLIANMELGYWVYAMKLRGYFFVPTIGTTAAVALLWAFRILPQKLWMRIAYTVLVVLVGYPLMGVYALAATLLMALWTWRLTKNHTHNIILSAAALLAMVAIPLFYYRYVYYQTNLVNIYWTTLPVFTIRESYPVFNTPYYILGACFLLFVFFYHEESAESPKQDISGKKQKGKNNKRPILQWAVQGALLAGLVYGVWHFWYKDDNFHHELRMQRCVEQTDWEGVVKEGETQNSEPTRAIVLMRNLALSRLGRQCDEMYNFRKGSSKTNTPIPVYMYNTAGRLIYYQYGMLNECHRMCMEQGVEFGWSVELLQYLTRCSLLSGETQAVRKYLTLLRQTQFYGDWADRIEKLLTSPELLKADQETGPVTHMLHYVDHMGSDDGFVEKNLMMQLSKIDSNDPAFQEQAVLAAMWTRDPNDFWPRLQRYMELRPHATLPRIFQEAAYLFGNMQELDIVHSYPFDQNVKDTFKDFIQQLKQYEGRSLHEVRSSLLPYYGHTYYYEYFFLKDITYF